MRKNNKHSITLEVKQDLIKVHHITSDTTWIVTNTPAVRSILESEYTHFTYDKLKKGHVSKYHITANIIVID